MNPKAVVVRGRKRSRGQEAFVSHQSWTKLIERVQATNTAFSDLLLFLHGTGCRPSEAYHVEARYYSPKEKCVIYPGQPGPEDFAWKNARKSGKDRVIFLNDDLVDLVERRARERATGPLFQTRHGRRWSQEAVSVNLRWYAKKLGITPAPTAYGFRHTYATNWLLRGGSITVLADLIGTSVAMIERHYGHIMVDKDRVRTMMMSVMGGSAEVAEAAVSSA